MQTLNIAIPDALNDYVLKQIEKQGYGSASEYVRVLHGVRDWESLLGG